MSAIAIAVALGVPVRAAAACPPAHFDRVADELPATWRAALGALLAATTAEGRPWSCSGARLSLHVGKDGRAELVVEDVQGRSVRREVPSPDDLVPMGEALLASPLAVPAGVPGEAAAAVASEKPGAAAPAPAAPDPKRRAASREPPRSVPAASPAPSHTSRIQIDALAGVRYTGPTRAFWAGGTLRVTLPFGAWSGGIWARADVPAFPLDPQQGGFSMTEVCVGVALDRLVLADPFELRIAFEPSIAVVSMVGGAEPLLYDGAKADPRLGVALRGAWPIGGGWRLLGGIEAEGAPAAAGPSKGRRVDPELPELPSFTVGVVLGAGLGLL